MIDTMNLLKPVSKQRPAFSRLFDTYVRETPDGDLRFGQWFMNRFMPYAKNDELYNTISSVKAKSIIKQLYLNYQWEM
jgi:hypothetical protein